MYLTNALTGWEPPKGPKQQIMAWAELQEERDAADHVKRDKKILVVLGNPPYNAFAGVSPEEEQGLVEPYKKDAEQARAVARRLGHQEIQPRRPVRSFLPPGRAAYCGNERQGRGIVHLQFFLPERSVFCGHAAAISCRVRQAVAGLHERRQPGNRQADPRGQPDPSVFSTDYNREGIRVGTAICVMVRKPVREKKPAVRFRHFWGANKRADLLDSLAPRTFDASYAAARPQPESRFSFRPEDVAANYTEWPKVAGSVRMAPFNGLMEKGGGALIDIDRDALESRMRDYFDASFRGRNIKVRHTALTEDAARLHRQGNAGQGRCGRTVSTPSALCRYALRPLETRWCYYSSVRPVWNRPRPSFRRSAGGEIVFDDRDRPALPHPKVSPSVYQARGRQRRHSRPRLLLPLQLLNGQRLAQRAKRRALFDLIGEEPPDVPVANLARNGTCIFGRSGHQRPRYGRQDRGTYLDARLAIGYSPAYLTENADGIRRDWPRIPLPDSREALEASAALGEQIAPFWTRKPTCPG